MLRVRLIQTLPPVLGVTLILFFAAGSALAAIEDAELQLNQISDREDIVDINHAGDGSGRLFLVDQQGFVWLNEGSEDQNTEFLDITGRVNSNSNEQGLLSIAFAPDYATSGYFYVWYTKDGGDSVLARFRVSVSNTDRADESSEQVLLEIAQPASNHNGGRIRFGPDGMLYLSTGDGGGANDPFENGQDGSSLLGKLLRLDVDPQHGTYAIPAGNPFVGDATVRDEIWALGLRNPWRISFDRANGDLFIADVGQSQWEEINHQPNGVGGQNYGWKIVEGNECVIGGCDKTGFTAPVHEYSHNEGCSITGGEMYRGSAYPNLHGAYLFGDYCQGTIWGLTREGDNWSATELGDGFGQITTFGEGEDGSIYMARSNQGVFLLSDGEIQQEPEFSINAGLNDAWYYPVTDGQGFLITVFPDTQQMFVAWFTFDAERPADDIPSVIGEPGHRWLIALGPYAGTTASLTIFVSVGGVFDSATPAPVTDSQGDGALTLEFSDCSNGLVSYEVTSAGLSGQIPIQRVVNDNVALCQALSAGGG